MDVVELKLEEFDAPAPVAQADETLAPVLAAEGRLEEGAESARAAAGALEGVGRHAPPAETLTRHGVALARLGRHEEAHATLRRAARVAEAAGDPEGAGLAGLSLLEELRERLAPGEAYALYVSADQLLARTQSQETLARLRAAARALVASDADGRLEDVRTGDVQIGDARTGAAEIAPEGIIRAACGRAGKRVSFEPAAVEAMRALLTRRGADELRAVVERTVVRAAEGATITASAVETLALRHDAGGADFTEPWAGFSFKEEVKSFEENLIARALRVAGGSVSRAARLLGFRHHESLRWRLKNRNKSLLPARTPARPRRRSIITKQG